MHMQDGFFSAERHATNCGCPLAHVLRQSLVALGLEGGPLAAMLVQVARNEQRRLDGAIGQVGCGNRGRWEM
jgi:hypothetical protein